MMYFAYALCGLIVVWLICRDAPASKKSDAQVTALLEYRFPRVVLDVFSKENPRYSAEQRELAFQGLREYFLMMLLAQQAGRKASLGMTSVLIDDAWHAFVLCTKQYEEFCLKVFGKMIHHAPNPDARPGTVDANTTFTPDVMNSWAAYRHAKTRYPDSFRSVNDTPLLFGLDFYAGLDDGWLWPTTALRSLEQQSRETAEKASAARKDSSDSTSSCSSCASFVSAAERNGASSDSGRTESHSSHSSSSSYHSSGSSSSHSSHSSHSSSCSGGHSSCSSSSCGGGGD